MWGAGTRVLRTLRVAAVLALAVAWAGVLVVSWLRWPLQPKGMQPGLFGLPGLWPYVPLAAIWLAQAVVVALMGHVRWWAAAPLALAAYAASLVVLVLLVDVDRMWLRLPGENAVVVVVGFLVEWPLVWAGLARCVPVRPQRREPRARWRQAALVALVMNLLSAPIIPGFWQVADRLELVGSPGRACLGNLKQIGLGLLMYREDHGGGLPPATDLAQLREALMPYVRNADLFHCYGERAGRYFPLVVPGGLYETADLTALGKGAVSEAETPVIWDSQPRHSGGRNMGYLDGHAQWVKAGAEQAGGG